MSEFSSKDLIGLIADLMAIFGVGGFFSWSFVKKSVEGRDIADSGIHVFAYSVKAFISIVFLVALFVPAFLSHFTVVLMATGNYAPGDGIWNPEKSFAYLFAYLLTAMWVIPVAIVSVSAIFTWSLTPFKKFWSALRGRDA